MILHKAIKIESSKDHLGSHSVKILSDHACTGSPVLCGLEKTIAGYVFEFDLLVPQTFVTRDCLVGELQTIKNLINQL